jgi:hypothetical protein
LNDPDLEDGPWPSHHQVARNLKPQNPSRLPNELVDKPKAVAANKNSETPPEISKKLKLDPSSANRRRRPLKSEDTSSSGPQGRDTWFLKVGGN